MSATAAKRKALPFPTFESLCAAERKGYEADSRVLTVEQAAKHLHGLLEDGARVALARAADYTPQRRRVIALKFNGRQAAWKRRQEQTRGKVDTGTQGQGGGGAHQRTRCGRGPGRQPKHQYAVGQVWQGKRPRTGRAVKREVLQIDPNATQKSEIHFMDEAGKIRATRVETMTKWVSECQAKVGG